MKTLEQQLQDRLHERAAAAGLQFTHADIRSLASGGTRPVVGVDRYRGVVLAAAAVVAVIGAAALYVSRPQAGISIESGSGEPHAKSETDVTVAAERVLRIEATDRTPQRLASDAIVLVAEDVGSIEVGPPAETLVAEQPWLKDARCVATETGVSCTATQIITNEFPPSTIEDAGYSFSEAPGWQMMLGAKSDAPRVFAEQDAAIIVSGLPDPAVTVRIVVGAATMSQQPIAGTTAFPITESGVDVRITAYDSEYKLLWDSATFDLPRENAGD